MKTIVRVSGCWPASRSKGFTLLEALVALVIIAAGLLGIAGMSALGIYNTSVSRYRGLAAILAESQSAAMSSNQVYWGGVTISGVATTYKPPTQVITSGETLSDSTLNGLAKDCRSSACTPDEMAAYDLKQWGKQIKDQLPGGKGQIDCTVASRPFQCRIQISWTEKNLAQRQASGTLSSLATTQTYQLIVQP